MHIRFYGKLGRVLKKLLLSGALFSLTGNKVKSLLCLFNKDGLRDHDNPQWRNSLGTHSTKEASVRLQ